MVLKELMSEEDYDKIKNIHTKYPIITFQNTGYQYIDKTKFNKEEELAFKDVSDILSKYILGFSEFNNFKIGKTGETVIRIQYNYGAGEENSHYFVGVGYAVLEDLKEGFK